MGLSEKLVDIKNQTDALITFANETTGESDTRLGEAVRRLASGYGGGGDSFLASGSVTFEDFTSDYTISEVVNLANVECLFVFYADVETMGAIANEPLTNHGYTAVHVHPSLANLVSDFSFVNNKNVPFLRPYGKVTFDYNIQYNAQFGKVTQIHAGTYNWFVVPLN